MAVYNGPPRGGSRGGQDQFSWDAVKADKDREYYLGHSVKALTGRWQKGKDVYWYTREKAGEKSQAEVHDELQSVKDREAQLMAEALGMKPVSSKSAGKTLDKQELNQLLERTKSTEGDGATAVKGLGYAPGTMGGLPAAHERLPAAGVLENEALPGPPPTSSEHDRKRKQEDQASSPRKSSKHHDEKRKKSKKSKKEKKDKSSKREKRHKSDKKHRRDSRSP